MFQDLLALFFPLLCEACQKPLVKGETIICTACLYHLPRTHSHTKTLDHLTSKFYGKLDIEQVYAFLYFRKNSSVQRLLHSLKYKSKPEIGHFLGKLYGAELSDHQKDTTFDFIIPVPLHKSRQRRRGYNQSEHFSNGLGEVLDKPVLIKTLLRDQKSETQTKKSRSQRWDNVKTIFSVHNKEEIKGKHILLTDDVMTTGATLEACAQMLFDAGAGKISVATIAVAV